MCEGCEERIHVGHQVHRIDRSISKLLEMRVKEEGLDEIALMHGWILRYLYEHQDKEIYQKDIEKEFGLRPSTATEVLKALEKKELICRVSEKQDARLKRIEFTSKAEEIRHLIAAEIGESESILLKGITEEERQIFIAIGERMLKKLDEANQ